MYRSTLGGLGVILLFVFCAHPGATIAILIIVAIAARSSK